LCLRAITRAYENNGDWTPRQESLTENCDESRTALQRSTLDARVTQPAKIGCR
jgi:hypothetical protein